MKPAYLQSGTDAKKPERHSQRRHSQATERNRNFRRGGQSRAQRKTVRLLKAHLQSRGFHRCSHKKGQGHHGKNGSPDPHQPRTEENQGTSASVQHRPSRSSRKARCKARFNRRCAAASSKARTALRPLGSGLNKTRMPAANAQNIKSFSPAANSSAIGKGEKLLR